MTLPVNLDATYDDDPNDSTIKEHQQHHDVIHSVVNDAVTLTGQQTITGLKTLIAQSGSLGLIVRSAAGHTGNLQEWRNSADVAVAKVTAAGAITATGLYLPGANADQPAGFEVITDPLNTNKKALVIVPPDATTRVYLGRSSDPGKAFSLNMQGTSIENLPSVTLTSGVTFVGSATTIVRATGGGQQQLNYTARDANGAHSFLTGTTPVEAVRVASGPGNPILTVKGAATQTADLLRVETSTGSAVFRVTNSGATWAGDYLSVGTGGAHVRSPDQDGSLRLYSANGRSIDLNSGNALNIVAQAVNYSSPNSNTLAPTGLGVDFTASGTNAPIDHSVSWAYRVRQRVNGVDLVETYKVRPTGSTSILLSKASEIGLSVKGAASQTADLLRVEDSAGTVAWAVKPDMKLLGHGNASVQAGTGLFGDGNTMTLGAVRVTPRGGATGLGIVVQGAASQSGHLIDWRDSAGTSLGRVYANGTLAAPTMYADNFQARSFSGSYIELTGTTAGVGVVARDASHYALRVKGAVAQTADLLRLEDSSAALVAAVSSAGRVTAKGGITSDGGGLAVTGSHSSHNIAFRVAGISPGHPVAVLKGATNQTADLTQWRSSTEAVVASVSPAGDIEITDATRGVILRSPNGTRYRLKVADGGALSAIAV